MGGWLPSVHQRVAATWIRRDDPRPLHRSILTMGSPTKPDDLLPLAVATFHILVAVADQRRCCARRRRWDWRRAVRSSRT